MLCKLDTIWILAAWFLLLYTETIAYNTALACLRDDLEVPPPDSIHLDYELAGHRAVNDIYPSSKVVSNLYTSFSYILNKLFYFQAIKKNLSKHGLLKTYNSDLNLQVFICKIWFLLEFLMAVECLAKTKVVQVASSTIFDHNHGRMKKMQKRRGDYQKLVQNYSCLKDVFCSCTAKWS